ncbi:MAG: NADPH-dependent 7-cyano-7-deazaguanine reductase QueF, partial [Muribaculaceae bacterium]|nr:NADPH-dependent 7-cyano-7-deazaguanine reductase QueF [Muribaculaceae bacterium]
MSRTEQELDGVTLLGNNSTHYPTDYAPEVLETFVNRHPGRAYLVTLTGPAVTSLCTKTAQPDFARILRNYL